MSRRAKHAATICALLLLAAAAVGFATRTSTAAFEDTGVVTGPLTSVTATPLTFAGTDAGDEYSLGWSSDGTLFAWGSNSHGQLGDGTVGGIVLEPRAVQMPDGLPVVDAAAGPNLSIALTNDGGVFVWGNPGVTPNTATPQRLPLFDGLGDPVVGVDVGGFYYLAWTQSGRLYSWGNTGGGRLGRLGTGDSPALVTAQGLDTMVVAGAAAGRFHGVAQVAGSSTVIAWGNNLGAATGTPITGLASTTAGVEAGTGVTLIWDTTGQLFTASGAAASTVAGAPSTVGATISAPTAGASSQYAWNAAGQLFAWGRNDQGQLGLGTSGPPVLTPVLVPLVPGSIVLTVGAGGDHALYVGADSTFSSAGANTSGQLGTGTTASRNSFGSGVPIYRWPQ